MHKNAELSTGTPESLYEMHFLLHVLKQRGQEHGTQIFLIQLLKLTTIL